MISSPWLQCRLPVGSSASTMRGLRDHGARNGDLLLLAARELRRVEILLADHLEAIEDLGDARLALFARHVAVRQRDLEILVDRQVVEQMKVLEHEADVLFVDACRAP